MVRCTVRWSRCDATQADSTPLPPAPRSVMLVKSCRAISIPPMARRAPQQNRRAGRRLGRQDGRQMSEEGTVAAALRDLYETAPCGYHSVGPDGSVMQINRTELAWLGYARAELVGRRAYADSVSARCRSAYLRSFGALRDGQDSAEIECELVRKDTSVLDALLRIAAVREPDGTFLSTRTTVIDISARKRAETDARRYAAQLRAISQRIVEVQENERRNLAAELHDRIGQDLATIDLNLHLVKDLLPAGSLHTGDRRVRPRLGLRHGTPLASRGVPGETGHLSSGIWNLGVFSRRCTGESLPLRVDFIHRVEFEEV